MSDSSEIDEAEARGVIEKNVRRIVRQSTIGAQHMAAKLNGTVYLVGSILHAPSPRDVEHTR